jgi:hypothetical protein
MSKIHVVINKKIVEKRIGNKTLSGYFNPQLKQNKETKMSIFESQKYKDYCNRIIERQIKNGITKGANIQYEKNKKTFQKFK